MKQRLIMLRDKIDALSVRERVIMFCATVGAIVFLTYSMVLTPLFAREQALQTQIKQQRNNIAGIDAEIVAVVQGYAIDPDAEARARLAVIKNDMLTLSNGMRAMQTGLVAPEQIAPLLETMLKANGRLRLVSLTTLPVSSLTDDLDSPTPAAGPAAANAPGSGLPREVAATFAAAYPTPPTPPTPPAAAALIGVLAPAAPAPASVAAATSAAAPLAPAPAPAVPLLYRHGVELAVRGNYLDMVSYMDALEAMPAQLIWSKASLSVEEYPNARLTLRVYTLSLDKKWMKL